MKITFEGKDIADIVDQVSVFIADVVLKVREYPDDPEQVVKPPIVAAPVDIAAVEKELRAPWPVQKVKPPIVEKPKRVRTERQLANDEKLRERALARIEAKKAAKVVEKPVEKAVKKPVEKAVEKTVEEPEVFADPAEAVSIRNKTISDLQEAYANGHQQEVFELLSRFGNGAKSFRELPPEAFRPIREAIDKGALT